MGTLAAIMTKRATIAAALLSGALLGSVATDASAFCGFYVGGADATLFNNATQVVLMRDGVRTVLSMSNNYQGPPEGFAMVVPVPVVLHEENVKTLPKALFERVDKVGSPRLVEYWEQDPCPPPTRYRPPMRMMARGGMAKKVAEKEDDGGPPPVKVEAEFVVGEYQIVILSATDSLALDRWIRQNGYRIPAGAEPYLRPYVQQGLKFFVAKVDPKKVAFQNGQAMLSPLRFHYDSEQFHLPIRLGLINSSGSQDLIVNILAKNQRYDVVNYENVAIPTNIDVADATRQRFPAFYTSLFEHTLQKHPRAVVTEYSWQATSCDPCPTTPLQPAELMALGADVLPGSGEPQDGQGPSSRRWNGGITSQFVLTRLHARYSKGSLGDDLFFRAAPAIVGGREFVTDGKRLEQGAKSSNLNNFQARYAIRHPWTGPIKCAHPQRGIWGGPPGRRVHPRWGAVPAAGLGLVKAGDVQLAKLVKGAIPPETFLTAAGATPALLIPPSPPAPPPPDVPDAGAPEPPPAPPPPEPPHGGCAGCAMGGEHAGALSVALAALALAIHRRRSRLSERRTDRDRPR
jgi:hypothetical protein